MGDADYAEHMKRTQKMAKNKIKVMGIMLVDHSGSMSTCRINAEEAVNSFFTERKNTKGTDEKWALCEFDTKYDTVFSFTPVESVPIYTLLPRGMTALHDSVAKTINKLEAENPPKGTEKWVVVMTDGLENSSLEFREIDIKNLIESKQAEGWKIVYLGANQDAVEIGKKMGISTETSMTYDTVSSGVAMASVSNMLTRGASGQSYSFTSEERSASASNNSDQWI